MRRIASNLPLGPCPRVHFQVRDGIFLNYSALRKTSQYDRQRREFYQVELCMRYGKRPFCRMESIFPGSMKRSCDSCLCVNLLTSQLLSRSIDMDLRVTAVLLQSINSRSGVKRSGSFKNVGMFLCLSFFAISFNMPFLSSFSPLPLLSSGPPYAFGMQYVCIRLVCSQRRDSTVLAQSCFSFFRSILKC